MEELRKYIEELKGQFIQMTDNNYCNLTTGEIFTITEVNKYMTLQIEEFNKQRNAEVSYMARENGIEIDQRIVNTRSKKAKKGKCKERYDKGDFNMLYREEMENFMALKLTLAEEGFFIRLCRFLHYPSNSVMVKGEIPSIEFFVTIMGLKERQIRTYFKSLESKGVIGMVNSGHKKVVYINPNYCASGKDLDIETLKLFNLTDCNDNKIEDYLKMIKQHK